MIPNVIESTRPLEEHPSSELIKQFKKLEPTVMVRNYIGWSKDFAIDEERKTDTRSLMDTRISPVVPKLRVERIEPFQDSAISLQKWEGVVIEVKKESFIAELRDLITENIEETELPIEDISDEDRPLIESGAIFYWAIGYCKTYAGQVKKESLIRFRRLPTWNKAELTRAKKEAKEYWGDIVGR